MASFLTVGHLAKDLTAEGWILGGGVTYAALTAKSFGYETAVLTRAAPEVAAEARRVLAGVELVCLPSAETTTFRNHYRDGRREQHVLAVADALSPADVPQAWRATPLVLLTPLLGEVGPELADAFPEALLGLSAQGWLRRRARGGRVEPVAWQAPAALLRRAGAVVFSLEDIGGDRAAIAPYAAQTDVLVVTEGSRGATLYLRGEAQPVPAFAAVEVDPTGAGDVFAAAFLIALHETGDPARAALFASCAASFVVEQPGVAGIPSRAAVEQRLRQGA